MDGDCAHDACGCAVTDEAEFCSQHCETASHEAGSHETCDCGHADCGD